MKTKVGLEYWKVFWLSKGDSTGQYERNEKKQWEDNVKE